MLILVGLRAMVDPSGELKGFRKLFEFSRRLLSENNPNDLLARLVEATRLTTEADLVVLFLLEEGQPRMYARAGVEEVPEGRLEETPYSLTLIQEVIASGGPILLKNVAEDPRLNKAHSVQTLDITSAMGAPLFFDGKLAGIIYASRKRLGGNFTELHCELMTVAASQASLLIGRLIANEALKESEERHRALVEMSPAAILVMKKNEVLFANAAAEQLWRDCTESEESSLTGLKAEELFDGWRSKALLEALESERDINTLEGWARLRNGSEDSVPVVVRGRNVGFDGQQALQLLLHEIGEQKAGLARRVRTDRLVAMGTMAATVGHEINNPLAYVHANLDFVVEMLEKLWGPRHVSVPEEPVRRELLEGLRSAREGTERIRAVVESIQNFSRLDESEERPTEVREPLASSLRVAKNELGSNVEVQFDIRNTDPVTMSAARLGQVCLNLMINAGQALAKLPANDERQRCLSVRTRQEEREVVIEVADNGPGIDPKVQRHIFEPFVTTKSDEEGTGLGLAISKEIVENAGGTIEVESAPDKGAIFRIRLPAASEPETGRIEILEASDDGQSGQILIVDPDPTLARSMVRVLQTDHEVEAVSTIGEAVELLSRSRNFDVILCDFRLRGGLGHDLFRWVEKNSPRYWEKMVAMTTNRGTSDEQAYLEELPNEWLSKPFDINRLRALIDRVIARNREEVEKNSKNGSSG